MGQVNSVRYQMAALRSIAPAASLALAALALAGCTASGIPRFVKFSPDSRRLVYEDYRYHRVYIFDLDTHEKHVLYGYTVSIDQQVQRFVVSGHPNRWHGWERQLAYILVVPGKAEPDETKLPPLPLGPNAGYVCIEFGPGADEISAFTYKSNYYHPSNTPAEVYRMAPRADAWTGVKPVPDEYGPLSHRRVVAPGGIWEGGHVYCPCWEPEGNSMKKVPGVDVEATGSGAQTTYLLPSPDGRFVVRIGDVDDPWRRVTLTECVSGAREVILDKDDGASDVLSALGMAVLFPVNLLFQPIVYLLPME